jgi:hypothetical protein
VAGVHLQVEGDTLVDQFSLQRSHSPDPVVAGNLAGGRDRAVTADPTHSTPIGQ